MDFTYDGVYNSFTHSCFYNSSFPSVLSQTLCELDIDTSIHKLFEGLPEIFEDHSSVVTRDVDAMRDAVTVAASPLLPSTPPAQAGSRPSSVCGSGLPQGVNPVHELAARSTTTSARNVNATQQPVLIRPKGGQEVPQLVTEVAGRKVGRARKAKGGAGRGKAGDSSETHTVAQKKVLEAQPIPASQAPSLVSAVACMVPKILPATAIPVGVPAVDLSSVKVSGHVAHVVHPLHLGLGPPQTQVCFRAPKRSRSCRDATAQMANTRSQKTRYFDKVEHIVRERWRRDDMAGKFLALESLLPPSSKRDRSTIVEDSMKLVKSLQHRKEEAMKRRAELKQAAASGARQSPSVKLSRIIQRIGSLAAIPHQPPALEPGPPSSSSMLLSTSTGTGTKRPLAAVVVDDVQLPSDSSVQVVPKLLSDCVHRFYVQSELSTGDIVIEMICEQIPNFHSALLESMESLGLEVIRCSVTKTINKLICNITAKPFPSSASVNSSSTSIMEGLNSAFRKV